MAVFDAITVTSLKAIPPDLPLRKKLEIKEAGRPTPCLDIKIITKSQSRDFKREFKVDIYDKHSWLCGCEVSNRLYCFPCLLFKSNDSEITWVDTGVADLTHLANKIKRHESARSHLNAILEYNLLGKAGIRQQIDPSYRHEIKTRVEQYRKNRIVLSKIVDSIKECNAFEVALRGFDDGKGIEEFDSSGDSGRRIDFAVELYLCLQKNLTCPTDFNSSPEDILNDLLDCMLTVCQDNIRKEMAAAEFVSVIADETTDFSNSFQLAIVYRYVLSDGRSVERFWQFCNPPVDDAKSIAGCIHSNLESVIDNPEKLVAQSYDGATIMGRKHGVVQSIILQLYKRANFVNYYAHDLYHILQLNSECQHVRNFFSNLMEVNNFFNETFESISVLDEVVAKMPQTCTEGRLLTNLTDSNVQTFRTELMDCLGKIESSSKLATKIFRAGSIRRILCDPSFMFWLTLFKGVIPKVDFLCKELQKTYVEGQLIRKHISHFKSVVEKEKENMVKVEVADEPVDSGEPSAFKRRKVDQLNRIESAKSACDVIVHQVQKRFSFTTYFTALCLFDPKKFDEYENCFPTEMLNEIEEVFPFLENERLITELSVIYRRKELRGLSETAVLLQFIIENNLQSYFSETYKLLQITCTYPASASPGVERFSALKRIRTFLSNSVFHEDRASALAMLSVEKDMVDGISDFNNKVVELFCAKQERTEFVFETCS